MGRGAVACDVCVNVGMTANQDTVVHRSMSILEIHTLGQPHCVDTFLGMDMHCSFDSIVIRVGDVGAGIIGEVFSGGEEGPGSLARHLRVGRHSESPGATFTFHR